MSLVLFEDKEAAGFNKILSGLIFVLAVFVLADAFDRIEDEMFVFTIVKTLVNEIPLVFSGDEVLLMDKDSSEITFFLVDFRFTGIFSGINKSSLSASVFDIISLCIAADPDIRNEFSFDVFDDGREVSDNFPELDSAESVFSFVISRLFLRELFEVSTRGSLKLICVISEITEVVWLFTNNGSDVELDGATMEFSGIVCF